jgi:hypothetical protein
MSNDKFGNQRSFPVNYGNSSSKDNFEKKKIFSLLMELEKKKEIL